MSTFIEVRPEASPNTRTTAIRIDDDLKVTIRTESGASHTDHQFNYTGADVDVDVTTVDPIEYVRVTKIGTDVRATIAVKCYYLDYQSGAVNTVPAAGIYWYNPETHYNPELPAEMGKTAAPNPTFEGTTQAFPVTIFAPDPITPALPVGNSVAAPTIPRLYARLGSLEARRAYLKRKLLATFESNDFFLMAWDDDNDLDEANFNNRMRDAMELIRTSQAYMFRVKMLALALSIDANFDTEQKFNLLNGEIGYDPQILGRHLSTYLLSTTFPSSLISGWQFGRLGRIGNAEPWTWLSAVHPMAITFRTNNVAGVNITNANLPARLTANNGSDWLEWLRE